jgi:PadR family transcriptional regulator PadR
VNNRSRREAAGEHGDITPQLPVCSVGAVVTRRRKHDETETPSDNKIYSHAKITVDRYMYDLTGFQRDILYIIAGDEQPHGLAIKDDLNDYYDQDIQQGRLYPNLDTLVENGLVAKGTIDQRTNSYELTRRGHRKIEARDEWEAQYVEQ